MELNPGGQWRCVRFARVGACVEGSFSLRSWLSQDRNEKKEPDARVCAWAGRGVRAVRGVLRGAGRVAGVGGCGGAAALRAGGTAGGAGPGAAAAAVPGPAGPDGCPRGTAV